MADELQLDPEQPWSQLVGRENNLWHSRFLIFRDMGPVRSILGAQRIECHRVNKEPPRWTARSWREKSVEYQWHKRAEAWDEYQRREVFNDGYAYDLVRIKKINTLLDMLEKRLFDALNNMKPTKGGFPDFIAGRYLEALDAIAKETGGRVRVTETKLDGTLNVVGAKESLLGKLSRLTDAEEEDA